MSRLTQNKWKYSTIGLLAVLAVGFYFPQAFAHVTNNVLHMVQDIFADTQAIKAKTDNLPSDPASQSNLFTQVISANDIISSDASQDSVECTSDADFIVHIAGTSIGSSAVIAVSASGSNTYSLFPLAVGDANVGVTIGGQADDVLIVAVSATSTDGAVALVTLQTTEEATASCEVA